LSLLRKRTARGCVFLVGEILPEGGDLPERQHYSEETRLGLNQRLRALAGERRNVAFFAYPDAMSDVTTRRYYKDQLHFSSHAVSKQIRPAIEAAWSSLGAA
jgi:hypothetical protein